MQLPCSRQLYAYLRMRRGGTPTEAAASMAGLGIGEARLQDQAEKHGELARINTEMPLPSFYQPTEAAAVKSIQRPETAVNEGRAGGWDIAPSMDGNASTSTGEPNMARRRTPKADQVEEILKPDFDLAVRLYRNDIKPAQSKVGEHAQEMSQAYKDIKKRAHIQPAAAKLAFKLDNMEESKRDDFLRCFNGLLRQLNIFMPNDLVDAAEGKGDLSENVVPIGEPKAPQLATIPQAMH